MDKDSLDKIEQNDILNKSEEKDNKGDEIEDDNENDKLLQSPPIVTERRDYDDDYTKLLQLKQEMVEKEKTKKPWDNKKVSKFFNSFSHDKTQLVIVAVLFVMISTFLLVIYHFHKDERFYIYKGHNFVVSELFFGFELTNELDKKVLNGTFWKSKPKNKLPYDCSKNANFLKDVCMYWKKLMNVTIVSQSWPTLNVSCYEVLWLREKEDLEEQDCFYMKDGKWFGGGVVSDGGWPLNQLSFSKRSFVTGSSQDPMGFNEVLEKYWISSNGVGLFVDEHSEIQISINQKSDSSNETDNQFCLYSNSRSSNLKYTVCVAPNMTAIHEIAAPKISPRPQTSRLNYTLVEFNIPFWSTCYFNTLDYTQKNILQFAKSISNFNHRTLLIDHGWESLVGDMRFSNEKFSNVTKLMEDLHHLKFRVSLATHTYIEPTSSVFQEASVANYLVKDKYGKVPELTIWNNNAFENNETVVVGVLDLNRDATEWYIDRLKQFQLHFSIDSFHFSGGSVSSLPLYSSLKYLPFYVNNFTYLHNKLSSSFGPLTPVESAYMSQDLDIIVRMSPRRSTWSGIQSIIPTALSLSLSGYNLFIPEAAGGSITKELLTKELYIRWMQLNTFLPFTHFSIPPNQFDEETNEYAISLDKFRSSLVIPAIKKFFSNDPHFKLLIKPVWWYSPNNEDAISCKDEFVVGDKYLIAPILEEGARNRNIFLPNGIWDDKPNDAYHIGPTWLSNYSVPLKTFAYFVKK